MKELAGYWGGCKRDKQATGIISSSLFISSALFYIISSQFPMPNYPYTHNYGERKYSHRIHVHGFNFSIGKQVLIGKFNNGIAISAWRESRCSRYCFVRNVCDAAWRHTQPRSSNQSPSISSSRGSGSGAKTCWYLTEASVDSGHIYRTTASR